MLCDGGRAAQSGIAKGFCDRFKVTTPARHGTPIERSEALTPQGTLHTRKVTGLLKCPLEVKFDHTHAT